MKRNVSPSSSFSVFRASRRLGVLAACFVALAFVACDGVGLTTEEATDQCDRLRDSIPSCFSDETYDQCISCHESCGRECSLQDSCPHEFLCDG